MKPLAKGNNKKITIREHKDRVNEILDLLNEYCDIIPKIPEERKKYIKKWKSD